MVAVVVVVVIVLLSFLGYLMLCVTLRVDKCNSVFFGLCSLMKCVLCW